MGKVSAEHRAVVVIIGAQASARFVNDGKGYGQTDAQAITHRFGGEKGSKAFGRFLRRCRRRCR